MDWCLWAYRQVYWIHRTIVKKFCPREEPLDDSSVKKHHIPWLWIGVKYEDNELTMTEVVNSNLEYGLRVTPEFLYNITRLEDNGTWRYLDSKTLEVKDFPSEGFIIEDVIGEYLSSVE